MSNVEDIQMPDVKKILGSPKITFVLGGPASGKGTQCAKLVEEFGYTHISTGDLFRAEVAKGSREGEMMKRIMNEGGLIPYQLTVQVLVNALIAQPSKNYLIDGFPRAKDQAVYFEQVVGEAQAVLYFNTPLDVCVARCLERAKTSGRADDTEEVILARLKTYEDQSKPVIEMYQKFGKVHEVDGSGDTFQVWNLTRKAMLPQVSFMIGPKISGKNTLGTALVERSNAKLLNFNKFCEENDLAGKSDDDIVLALIQQLSQEISPRVVITDFPQTAYQAKFFVKNGVHPHRVFILNCSKDSCQERMLQVPVNASNYLPSSLLSKKIGQYNENLKELLPFLKANTETVEVSSEGSFVNSFKQICASIEPTVISVRSSGSKDATAAKNAIMAGLVQQEFIALEVNDLIQLEVQRQTSVGRVIQDLLNNGKNVWSEPQHIVEILKNIMYSGIDGQDQFLLIGFPDQIEHATLFEKDCSKISAIIYTTAKGVAHVEVKGDDLSLLNIDSLFAKEFRLKTMTEWDSSTFAMHLGKKVNWGMFTGRSFSGKTTIANALVNIKQGKVINMANIAESLKAKMGTEDEPFEGDVPIEQVEEAILELVSKDRAANQKFTYCFDGWLHKTTMDFINAMHKEFGLPTFYIHCQCESKVAQDRYKLKNEMEGDLPEETVAELEEAAKKAEEVHAEVDAIFSAICINTDGSLETTLANLRNKFSAKVLIVNHEKRLDVDTTCSNLAIKYNMLYLSVYQSIKQNIMSNTPIGKELQASRKDKSMIKVDNDEELQDVYEENQYSAVHFDINVVIKMIQGILAEKRTNQPFIILEGLFNNKKLEDENEKLTLRYMDELFMIEKCIGEIAGVISLQYHLEPTLFMDEKWEEFEEPVVEQKPAKIIDEEGNEVDAPVAVPEDDGEVKAPKFNPAEFKWTVTNRRARNLPQVFKDFKGLTCICEEKPSESFGESAAEAVTKSLNEFCMHVLEQKTTACYQQIIFQE